MCKMENIAGDRDVRCSLERFRSVVEILVRKPNSVNKRVVGASILAVDDSTDISNEEPHLEQLRAKFANAPPNPRCLAGGVPNFSARIIRRLVPKNVTGDKSAMELIRWEIKSHEASITFTPLEENRRVTFKCAYQIRSSALGLFLDVEREADPATRKLLVKSVFECVKRWCGEDILTSSPPSMRLVDLEMYQRKYMQLKETHGKKLIENWTESTDPEKFVHEDVAIATYLILLWEEEDEKPTFIDLGCGNGLLVYILSREGYTGRGVDIRRRNIWDAYGDGVDLR